MALVDCGGGGGDTSSFDSGAPIGTTPVDSGGGTIGDDQGDATAPGITVTGPPSGNGDGGGGGVDCDATPLACVPQVCGDSVIEPGETCDDGNMASGDGCSSSCQLEGDYYACVAGQPCVDTRNCDELVEAGVIKAGADSGCSAPVKVPVCGDGFLDPGEACDTGGDVGTPISGCAADCSTAFQGYVCPTAGTDCTNTWICGDGKIEGSEACDEGPGNKTAGCSAATATPACAVTPGWTCTIPGVPCVAAKCGDGIVAGSEQCDIGTTTQPGCNTTTCQLQSVTTTVNPGKDGTTQPSSTVTNYTCAYAKTGDKQETCTATVCGNNKLEGSEQCDDGNTRSYDGCSSTCQVEPDCHDNVDSKGNAIQDGTCVAVCGDGLLFNFDADNNGTVDEACDDGNTINGDGCSSTCTVEKGYACTLAPQTAPAYIDVPIVYRDMLYSTTKYQGAKDSKALVYGHPDFQNDALNNGFIPDLTLVALGGPFGGIPVFGWNGLGKDPFNTANTTKYSGGLTSASDLTDWYADVVNPDGLTGTSALTQTRSVRLDGQFIRMTEQGSTYIFDSNCDAPYGYGTYSTDGTYTCTAATPPTGTKTLGGFFPIDGKGWFAAPYSLTNPDNHNFSFTTQFRYYFTFDPTTSATLTFTGDDDVYVYMNGQRVVDIGGVHGPQAGTYTLDKNQKLGMVAGHVYEVDLFNAERHTSGSNFRLALTGFSKSTSVCGPVCGDDFRTPNELCDNGTPPLDTTGTNTNDGSYGSCTTSCKLGPYCGDATPNKPEEACDNGVNQTPYATSAAAALASCAPGCVEPAYCGDDKVQGSYGELCDNGTANSDTAYGGCTTKCALGPRCGDQIVQTANGEVCDNGFNATPYVSTLASDSCAPGCKLPAYCGNGTVDVPYEICDNGSNNSNAGAYDSCTTSCKLGPHCGDGIVQSPQEQCDDGNQRSGDGCSAGCQTEGGGIR
jgi:fibro-slime domain-containing protein